MPSISVVIPAYNSARFLPEAVASVLAQNQPVHEIVIVDDGSTDDTPRIAPLLAPNIVYIRQPNAGPSAARNRGIGEARGEYIAFLDADDQWVPDKNAKQLAIITRHPQIALVAGDMTEIDTKGNIVTASALDAHGLKTRFQQLGGAPVPNALHSLLEKNFIPTGTVLAKRDVLLAVGGFAEDIRYGEDLELWARIAAQHPIVMLPDVLMLRRRHGTNATANTEALLTDLVKVAERIRDWENQILTHQDLDTSRIVANAWADLGYHHFDTGRFQAARTAFARSLHARTTIRAALYWIATMIPAAWIPTLRRLKEELKI